MRFINFNGKYFNLEKVTEFGIVLSYDAEVEYTAEGETIVKNPRSFELIVYFDFAWNGWNEDVPTQTAQRTLRY